MSDVRQQRMIPNDVRLQTTYDYKRRTTTNDVRLQTTYDYKRRTTTNDARGVNHGNALYRAPAQLI